MKLFKFIFHLLIVILLSTFAHATEVKKSNFTKEWSFPTYKFVVYDRMLAVSKRVFLYAVCNEFIRSEELNCKFVLENLSPVSNEKTMTCEIQLTASTNREVLKSEFMITKLESSMILITWTEKQGKDLIYSKYSLLNMKNCRLSFVNEVFEKYDNSSSFWRPSRKLIIYRKHFDIIDYNGKSCGSEVCRISYNSAGEQKTSQALSNYLGGVSKVLATSPVNFYSSEKNFFALVTNETSSHSAISAVLVNEAGNTEHLVIIPEKQSKIWYTEYAKGRFAVCWQEEPYDYNVKCTQFSYNNFELKKVFSTRVYFMLSEYVIAIYNLNPSGLLLWVGSYLRSSKTFFNYRGIIVDENGSRTRKSFNIEVPDFKCNILKGSESVDIIQQPINIINFSYAIICKEDETSDNPKIVLKYHRLNVTLS